jgi:hypothetical protein
MPCNHSRDNYLGTLYKKRDYKKNCVNILSDIIHKEVSHSSPSGRMLTRG